MSRRALAIPMLAIALALAGCAPAQTAAPPPDVTVSLYQPRPDVAANRMAIQVHNGGTEPVDLRSAQLTSPAFAESTEWTDDSATVLPGRALDLRVDIPAAQCADAGDIPASVRLEFADGTVVELEADDPYDLLVRFSADACLVEAVERIATLGPAHLEARGGAQPADLVIHVQPTGDAGSFTIVAALATTLLQPAVEGVGVPEAPVGVTIEDGGATEVRIPLVPNRCDPHALAEDKVGTRIPLLISTGDIERGGYVIPADESLRAAMYEFFSTYCGL